MYIETSLKFQTLCCKQIDLNFEIEQWFSKVLSLRTPPHCTQNRCGPLRFVNVSSIFKKLYFRHLAWASQPTLQEQISGFGLPPTALSIIKRRGLQPICNMSMSGYNCGAIKLMNNPYGGIKLAVFFYWILVYELLKTHSWNFKGFTDPQTPDKGRRVGMTLSYIEKTKSVKYLHFTT